MKKYFFSLAVLLLSACSSTSSNFTHLPLPNFKADFAKQEMQDRVSINVKEIEVQRINQYSKDFESSVLRIRLDEELKLLVKKLQKQSEDLLRLRGYDISSSNPDYTLYHKIDVYIEESDIKRKNQWLSGEELSSMLHLSLSSNMQLKGSGGIVDMNTNVKFQAPIAIEYPVKTAQGTSFFKTVVSTVPTQINKGLEVAVFDIDKLLLKFYKDSLSNLDKNALNLKSDNSSEETVKEDTLLPSEEVIIFE